MDSLHAKKVELAEIANKSILQRAYAIPMFIRMENAGKNQ
jgi:hypothetical protein